MERYVILFLSIFLSAHLAHASVEDKNPTPAQVSYLLTQNADLDITSSVDERVQHAEIPAGTVITPLESRIDERGELQLRLAIDIDEDSNIPSDGWIAANELDFKNMLALTDAQAGDELIQILKKTPSCYRDVKLKLLAMKKVKTYPAGAAAWMGYKELKYNHGFHDVAFSQNLPNGAVCVSEGGKYNCGNKKCGHIAVKIGYKQWYGAGVFVHPLLRNHYNLRCLVK